MEKKKKQDVRNILKRETPNKKTCTGKSTNIRETGSVKWLLVR